MATAVATVVSAALGTAAYKAPEQFEDDEINTKSEVYSFAIVLWELLHGAQPWAGRNEVYISRRVCDKPPPENRPLMTVGYGTLRQLAESCWPQAAADRPSFADVVARLAAAMRTYATSDFKVRNDALSARVRGVPPQPGQPLQTFEVLAGVQAMVFEYAHRHGIDLEVAAAFFDQEQRHALTASAVGHAGGAAVNEMLDQVQLIALRMYTSASKLPPGDPNGKELCSILQEAMVLDCTQHAVLLSRAVT